MSFAKEFAWVQAARQQPAGRLPVPVTGNLPQGYPIVFERRESKEPGISILGVYLNDPKTLADEVEQGDSEASTYFGRGVTRIKLKILVSQ